jgi:hypothetical protein
MTQPANDVMEEEEKGIRAIQFLQKIAGIDVSYDLALIGWRKMSAKEKEKTLDVYVMLGGGEVEDCLNTTSPL